MGFRHKYRSPKVVISIRWKKTIVVWIFSFIQTKIFYSQKAFFDEIEEETWQSKQSFETLHLFRLEKEFETPIPLYRKTVLLLKDHLNPAFTDMRFFGSDIPINRSSAQTLSSQIGKHVALFKISSLVKIIIIDDFTLFRMSF